MNLRLTWTGYDRCSNHQPLPISQSFTMLFHSLSSPVTLFLVSSFLVFSGTKSEKCPVAENCLNLLQKGETCPLFPMVSGSIAPPPGPRGFFLTRLRPDVYFYCDGAYHSLIAYSFRTNHLVVVDFPRSPNSLNETGSPHLISAVSTAIGLSIPQKISLVYSHSHLDHIGSAGPFLSYVQQSYPNATVEVWGSAESRNILSRYDPPKAPLPTLIIGSHRVILIVSQFVKIEMSILAAHSKSDVLVYIPPQKGKDNGVVYFLDVVTPREAPFSGFTFAVDLWQFLAAHRQLLKKNFAYLIPGHGLLGNKRDVVVSFEYAKSVIDSIQNAIRQLDPQDIQNILARVGDREDVAFGNGVWSFISIINLQIDQCVKDTIKAWGCKLSAVDIFAESHCRAAAFYVLTDI